MSLALRILLIVAAGITAIFLLLYHAVPRRPECWRHLLPGAVFATLGVLFPPILIVLVISAFFWSFAENPWVAHALVGVRACVCALIANSTIKLFKKAVLDLPTFLVFAVVFVLAAFCGVTPALLVAGSGVFGLALYQVRKGAGK